MEYRIDHWDKVKWPLSKLSLDQQQHPQKSEYSASATKIINLIRQIYGDQRLANRWKAREKLLAKGAEALSDEELLAILLRSGYAKQTGIDLVWQLLAKCDEI